MNEIIRGWLSPEVAEAMRSLVLETKPDVMVEIGVFAGKSLIVCAQALRANGKGVIYGIDPWSMDLALKNMGTGENPSFWSGVDLNEVHSGCVQAIRENGLENVVLIRAPSEQCHQLFQPKSVDILYIDGGHSEPQSCLDVVNYLPKVKKDGHIWIDDADWMSTQKAIKMLEETCVSVKDFGYAILYRKS